MHASGREIGAPVDPFIFDLGVELSLQSTFIVHAVAAIKLVTVLIVG